MTRAFIAQGRASFHLVVLLSTLILSCVYSVAVPAATVIKADRTEWRYFNKYDSNWPVDMGCFSSDTPAASANLSFRSSQPNACPANFSHWDAPWPDGEEPNSYHQRCPPAIGYVEPASVHSEDRGFRFTQSSNSPDCDGTPAENGDTITRQFWYYCADSDNFELIFPAVGYPEPTIPACKMKLTSVDKLKQPRGDDCCNRGNPINVATASKYQRETDYVGAGAFPLRFDRHYYHDEIGGLWTTTYSRNIQVTHLRITLSSFSFVYVNRDDGQQLTFWWEDGAYKSDPDVTARLVRLWTAGAPSGWKLTLPDDSVEQYDVAGRLVSVKQRSGLMHTLTYSSGRLATIADQYGRQLTLGYDSSARLSTLTLPGGTSTSYGYDSSGRLSSVTYPDTTSKLYFYNESAHTSGANLPQALTGIQDESGARYATFSYDTLGRAVSTEHAGGVDKVQVNYTSDYVRTVTDALGTARSLQLSPIQNVLKLTSAGASQCPGCSDVASYSYSPNFGTLSSTTDFNGTVRTFTSTRELGDARDLEAYRSEPLNPGTRDTQTEWHPAFARPAKITTAARETTFTYSSSGNQLTRKVSDTSAAKSRTWTYTYNSVGQVLTENGPRTDVSDVTTFTYHSCTSGFQCGQLNTVTNASGHVTTYSSYNAHGQPLTILDANGVTTTLTYDARMRLTSRTVGGETTSITYWPTGKLKRVTAPDGSYLQYGYDAAQRLASVTESDGSAIIYTLDLVGNILSEDTKNAGAVTRRYKSRTYNATNRLLEEIGAAGTPAVTTSYTHDGNGNPVSQSAPLARSTAYSYDSADRLTSVTDPLAGSTTLGYDVFDNVVQVVDSRALVTAYTFNALRDLLQVNSPDTGITTNTYDSGGNLKTSTDARSAVTTYGYDAINRVTSAAFKIGSTTDQTITYSYDAGANGKGHVTSASDTNHSLSWTYDAQGRVLSKAQVVGAVTRYLVYGYTNGNLISITLPSGVVVTYSYNGNRQIASVSIDSNTLLSGATYEPFGDVKGWTWGNTTTMSRTYDMDGRVETFNSAGLKTVSYDDASRISSIDDNAIPANSWSYGYDANDRLTTASKTGTSQSWSYDANGNRLTDTASSYSVSPSSNRIDSMTGALTRTYTYDAAGNTRTYSNITAAYNNRGRMKSLTKASVTASYVYDALEHLVKQSGGPSGTVIYVYDEEDHLIGEYDGSGAVIQETVWLGNIPVATIRPNGSGGYTHFYVHANQLNAPFRVTRPSDNKLMWTWYADPFGTDLPNENPAGAGTFKYNLRFPGQIYDLHAGLHYNYHREYDPQVGRYVQSDPIGLDGGMSTYVYASGSPLMRFDQEGLLDSLPEWLVDGVAGFGGQAFQAMTFGLGDLQSIRDLMGIDGGVDPCSSAYGFGEFAAMLPPIPGRVGLAAKAGARKAAKEFFRKEVAGNPLKVIRDRNTGRIVGVSDGRASYRPKGDGSYSVTPQTGRSRDTQHYRPTPGGGYSVNSRE